MAGVMNFTANDNVAMTDTVVVYSMPSDAGQNNVAVQMDVNTKCRTRNPGYGQIFPAQQNQFNNY
jgi:hypothetical protein